MIEADDAVRPLTLARRMQRVGPSPIRELTKRLAGRTDIISLAGGLPAREALPVDLVRTAADAVLVRAGADALQYGPTPGFGPLREWIAERHSGAGADVAVEQVQIVTGSQQALDLVAKLLIQTGSNVAVESPSYIGALQAMSLYEPRFRELACDDDGPIPGGLSELARDGVAMAYLIPTYQNPSGRMMPEGRRELIASEAIAHRIPIVEDDAYRDLGFQSPPPLPIRAFAPDITFYIGSFSKILSPGLRVGYVIAPRRLAPRLEALKQAADLHTPMLAQMIVDEVVRSPAFDQHVADIRALYASRAGALGRALARHMPDGVQWREPQGGMFYWLRAPDHIDTADLLETAIAQGVAYVPGAGFFAEREQRNFLRLSFATTDADRLDVAARTIAEVLKSSIG